MKKVVLAALLTCVALSLGLPMVSFAQAAAPGQVQMSDAEYQAYNGAMTQTTPQAKAQAIEAYLTAYPQSAVKVDTLVALILTYDAVPDLAKAVDAANRALQLDPVNLRALTYATALEKQIADAATDPAAKQTALDSAVTYAQKGLAVSKPATMADADFKALQNAAYPIFYNAMGADAIGKKDMPGAIDAYKKELAFVPLAQTQTSGPALQDTYFLALAYEQSTPPDYLSCAFYAARFVDYAPEPFKSQIAPTAKFCYKRYHGGDDGYDAVAAVAQANLFPPDGFQASVKPAPTPADIINGVLASTPDLAALAVDDREFILQNGTPDQASKVWDAIKGKSVELQGTVIASTATQLQVAIGGDATASKTADFTFTLKAPDAVPDLPAGATPAQKLAHTKAVKKAADDAAAIADASAVGKTVTIDGTYDSYTPKPLMITMTDGDVQLPKPTTPAHGAPAHHTPVKRAQ